MIWSDEIVEKVRQTLGGTAPWERYRYQARAVLTAIADDVVPRAVYDALDEVYQQTREALTDIRDELEQLRRDSVLRSEMTEERKRRVVCGEDEHPRWRDDHRFVTEWEPLP